VINLKIMGYVVWYGCLAIISIFIPESWELKLRRQYRTSINGFKMAWNKEEP